MGASILALSAGRKAGSENPPLRAASGVDDNGS
jgi:hypothetical protein